MVRELNLKYLSNKNKYVLIRILVFSSTTISVLFSVRTLFEALIPVHIAYIGMFVLLIHQTAPTPTQCRDPLIYFEERADKDIRLAQRLPFFAVADVLMITATRYVKLPSMIKLLPVWATCGLWMSQIVLLCPSLFLCLIRITTSSIIVASFKLATSDFSCFTEMVWTATRWSSRWPGRNTENSLTWKQVRSFETIYLWTRSIFSFLCVLPHSQ